MSDRWPLLVRVAARLAGVMLPIRTSRPLLGASLMERLVSIDALGRKEFGTDAWDAAKLALNAKRAPDNQDFLNALVETDNPTRLFAHFADDADGLEDLLNKAPIAMAVHFGRLDAGMAAIRPIGATLH